MVDMFVVVCDANVKPSTLSLILYLLANHARYEAYVQHYVR